ncbi:hypothetical protein RGU75_07250 [Glaciimonas sp. CA11.2]|uniref:hypothetical protein n=1 Tax=Glaciimonas sp. CA11.2 TaxID=3048601 RepID=UPI002AB5511F|nr:hypothetical protein [Glaciimonas sp. CA11.2]MDY7546025.1 hypothetical protein [Glaciimonas sp. CA11.2]
MHPDEKTLAKRLAANSDGKYTVEQVEDAMRSANNKALGEGVDAGAIVDVNGDTGTVYDDGAKWSVVERWQATISTADSFQYFSGFDDIHCTKFRW